MYNVRNTFNTYIVSNLIIITIIALVSMLH